MPSIFKKIELPLCALLCATLWGSAFPTIKTAYTHYIDNSALLNILSFAGIRFFIAGLLVLLFVSNPAKEFKKSDKRLLLTVTLCQVFLQYIFFYTGLARVTGVTGAILVSTGSFWWLLIAPFIDRADRINRKQFICVLLGFIGVCLAIYQPEDRGSNSLLGVLLMISACFCGALATVFVKPLNKAVSIPFITGFSLCLGGLSLIVISPVQSLELIKRPELGLKITIVYLACASACAFSLWFRLITRYDIARLSTYRFLIPIMGTIESAIFLKSEKIFLNTIVGGILVLIAAYSLEKLKVGKLLK